MTVTYQLSDRRGEAILLVKAEGPGEQSDQVYAGFAAAAQSAGLDASLEAFGNLPGAVSVATAILGGQPVPQLPQLQPWGQPPVPAYQPPAQPYQQPPMPAAAQQVQAAPQCQHGTKVHRTGSNDRGTWNAWACPAPKGDPTQCKFEFIR